MAPLSCEIVHFVFFNVKCTEIIMRAINMHAIQSSCLNLRLNISISLVTGDFKSFA